MVLVDGLDLGQHALPRAACLTRRKQRQVIADLVRLYFLLIEDVAQRALSQFGKAGVSLRQPMLTRMAGEKRRPQFVRIAEFLGLAAGEIHDPALAAAVIVGSLPGRKRRRNAGPSDMMVHPYGLCHRKKRPVFIRARSTRLAGSVRDRATTPNLVTSSSLSANSIACRHPAMKSTRVSESSSQATSRLSKNESHSYDRFHRIDELVGHARARM
jgi:hypothetical protein